MKRIKFRNYAGFKISGTTPMIKERRDTHLLRASYLTAMVESGGKFGCVINYDGTGMTAGIHQAIAVYPAELLHPDKNIANDQGPLWKLLYEIYKIKEIRYHSSFLLFEMMNSKGWYLAPDNTLRWIDGGKYVDGFTIREEFTGSKNGVAPLNGPRRKKVEDWMWLFHRLFSASETYRTQEDFGIEHFVKRANRAKLRFCKSKELQKCTLADTVYAAFEDITVADPIPELDLAMCMYWSHSVNAPGIALKKLCSVIYHLEKNGAPTFAKVLIRKLGESNYGRWSDDIKNGRYQRTRRFAMESGFWPDELFTGKGAIMPGHF